jgi:predicted transcriptional regulator
MDKNLQELTEVKLIILFILKNINMPLSHAQLTEIVMKDSLMNYFILHQYLSELVSFNQIKVSEESGKQIYDITAEGRQTLEFFENRIPYSIREKILITIINTKREFIKAREILSDYTPRNENEFFVECKIIENDAPLINLSLIVGTKAQAKSICEYWKTNAEQAYLKIISALTPDQKNMKKEPPVND